jgi:hypothetical protein
MVSLRMNDTLVERAVVTGDDFAGLQDSARAIAQWPIGSHIWGHYAEMTERGAALCRTENVSACAPAVDELVRGPLQAIASERLGEAAVAFKDKINYKQPGGAGFRPHQDAVAYPGVGRVVSLLLALDDCTLDSGCLWLAGGVDQVLPVDDRGVVRDDVCGALEWSPAELAAGDAVCIDGLAPHYSDDNNTNAERRVLVASYAAASSGYTRAHYYERRAEVMSEATDRDGRFRISTLADFAGTEVAPTDAARDVCTHSTVAE